VDIYDCHTHFDRSGRGKCSGDFEGWVDHLKKHGIGHAFMMGLKSLQQQESISEENKLLAKLFRRPDIDLIPFGTVNVIEKQKAVDEAKRCFETYGFPGLKLHLWLQGTTIWTETIAAICEVVSTYQGIIIFHDGTPPYAMSSQIAGLALKFPDIKVVLGHAGLIRLWKSALSWMERVENLWTCLCGPHMQACEEICRRLQGKKVLWGSDFDISLEDPIPYRLGVFAESKVDDEIKKKVLFDNPRELLGNET